MPENNTKGMSGFFGIDMGAVDNFGSYDFEKCDKIRIFMLTTTLPNPYTLVMFGVLKLFLENIKNKYPEFNTKLSINFLLIHEIAKYKKMTPFFNLITKHYRIFIPDELEELKEDLKEDALKRHVSSIIEMRLNEIKTLVNMILLNIVDAKEEMILTKENILNFSYDDIFNRSKEIFKNDEVKTFMNVLKEPESPQLKKLFFEKVDDDKDNLVKCLLEIFYHELSSTKEKTATFFIIDQWFKKMIEGGLCTQESPTAIFKDIYKQLICPIADPTISLEEEDFVLYLNPISKYMGAISELNVNYFSSLLYNLSCRLFKEHFEEFYREYDRYRLLLTLSDKGGFESEIDGSKERLQEALDKIINSGFLTVQEEEIIAQLIYIA